MVKSIIDRSDLDQKQANDYVIARRQLIKSLYTAHETVIERIIDKFSAVIPASSQALSTIVAALDEAIALSSALPHCLEIKEKKPNA